MIAKDGKEYTRVTEVLWVYAGLHNVPKHILDKACDRGSKVHLAEESIRDGEDPPWFLTSGVEGYIESYKTWAEGKEFLARPPRIFDQEYMITGEVDGLYRDDKGKVVLYDLKTSNRYSKTWELQASAYIDLLKLEDIWVDRAEFIHLHSTGAHPKVYTYDAKQSVFELITFKSCLRLYHKFNLNKSVQHSDYEI